MPSLVGSEMCIRDRYIPEGNSTAEGGFCTIIGVTRSLRLGAPHLSEKLWAEAFQAAVYIRNRTPTDVLGGEGPLEGWKKKNTRQYEAQARVGVASI